jgi:hypothetical protein
MLTVDEVAILALDATLPEARGQRLPDGSPQKAPDRCDRGSMHTIVAEVCPRHPANAAAARNLLRMGFEEIPAKVNWRSQRRRLG